MISRRFRPTLGQVFALVLAGTTLLLGLLFYVLLDASRRSLLESAQTLRDGAARRVAADIAA